MLEEGINAFDGSDQWLVPLGTSSIILGRNGKVWNCRVLAALETATVFSSLYCEGLVLAGALAPWLGLAT